MSQNCDMQILNCLDQYKFRDFETSDEGGQFLGDSSLIHWIRLERTTSNRRCTNIECLLDRSNNHKMESETKIGKLWQTIKKSRAQEAEEEI